MPRLPRGLPLDSFCRNVHTWVWGFDGGEPDEQNDSPYGISCVICGENYQTGQIVCKILNCNHAFHHQCITRWWAKSTRCPSCRFNVNMSRTASERSMGSASSNGDIRRLLVLGVSNSEPQLLIDHPLDSRFDTLMRENGGRSGEGTSIHHTTEDIDGLPDDVVAARERHRLTERQWRARLRHNMASNRRHFGGHSSDSHDVGFNDEENRSLRESCSGNFSASGTNSNPLIINEDSSEPNLAALPQQNMTKTLSSTFPNCIMMANTAQLSQGWNQVLTGDSGATSSTAPPDQGTITTLTIGSHSHHIGLPPGTTVVQAQGGTTSDPTNGNLLHTTTITMVTQTQENRPYQTSLSSPCIARQATGTYTDCVCCMAVGSGGCQQQQLVEHDEQQELGICTAAAEDISRKESQIEVDTGPTRVSPVHTTITLANLTGGNHTLASSPGVTSLHRDRGRAHKRQPIQGEPRQLESTAAEDNLPPSENALSLAPTPMAAASEITLHRSMMSGDSSFPRSNDGLQDEETEKSQPPLLLGAGCNIRVAPPVGSEITPRDIGSSLHMNQQQIPRMESIPLSEITPRGTGTFIRLGQPGTNTIRKMGTGYLTPIGYSVPPSLMTNYQKDNIHNDNNINGYGLSQDSLSHNTYNLSNNISEGSNNTSRGSGLQGDTSLYGISHDSSNNHGYSLQTNGPEGSNGTLSTGRLRSGNATAPTAPPPFIVRDAVSNMGSSRLTPPPPMTVPWNNGQTLRKSLGATTTSNSKAMNGLQTPGFTGATFGQSGRSPFTGHSGQTTNPPPQFTGQSGGTSNQSQFVAQNPHSSNTPSQWSTLTNPVRMDTVRTEPVISAPRINSVFNGVQPLKFTPLRRPTIPNQR